MPAFVKTKSDEQQWSKAKAAAGKKGSETNWALANYIFHHSKKDKLHEEIINDFLSESIDRFQDMVNYHSSNKVHSFIAFPKKEEKEKSSAEPYSEEEPPTNKKLTHELTDIWNEIAAQKKKDKAK